MLNINSVTEQNYYSCCPISFQGKGGNKKFIKKIKQRIINIFPEKTFGNSMEKWDKFNNFMAKPAENRALMGIMALLTQPIIDYYNHRVDEETREVSRNRTIAKIIAGTAVGIGVRELCYRIINSTTQPDKPTKLSKKFLPKKYIEELSKNVKYLKNYRNAISTILALSIMTFTNFLLDAPLTVYLTNKMNEYTLKKQSLNKFGTEVSNE